jgi:hypothetical protein
MPAQAHFQNLPTALCRHLSRAEQRIRIAVCWFSHRDIFDLLLKKLRAGVAVELILEYDNQNIHPQGLDFQKFIKLGGALYAYRDTALMHHKFAVVDDRELLTGSWNWTYSANAENLIATGEPELIAAFLHEFNRLKSLSVPIRKIRPAEVKAFATFPLFQNTHFQLTDLRRRISVGAGVWWVNTGRDMEGWAVHFREHRLPFDTAGLLRPYWTAYRFWDEGLFDEMWSGLQTGSKPGPARATRQLARRMQLGDVVLAVAKRRLVLALGIVQSDPKAAVEAPWSTYREVQWLRVLADEPLVLPGALSPAPAGRFRGSALRVVQTIFDR